MLQKIKIERTKKGYPALWEQGGGYSNTGESTIITDAKGRPKIPVYIRQRGTLANSKHALFVVQPGDHVIMADHHRRDFNLLVYQITDIQEDEAILNPIAEFSQGEWNNKEFQTWENITKDVFRWEDLPPIFQAVQFAYKKATCYHCREPHYTKEV